jgi:nucleoid DNA-binding protein
MIMPGRVEKWLHEETARDGRNPGTGEKMKIPASKVVKLKAGKTLSDKNK